MTGRPPEGARADVAPSPRPPAPDSLDTPSLLRRAYWRGLGVRSAADRHRAVAVTRGYAHALRWAGRAALARARGRPRLAIALVGHMGDIVAAEPVARWVRQRYPDAHVTWVVGKPYASLLECHPALDALQAMGCVTEWLAMREQDPFDILVDLHVRGRACPTCQIGLRREDGDAALDISNYYHFGSLLEVFCRSAGIPVLDAAPELHLPAATAVSVDRLPLPPDFLVVHARSNQTKRDWRDERWRELFALLARRPGLPVVEVGLDPVGAEGSKGYLDLCGRLSIPETAEVIRRARAFVGIDSGPAHLANAVGTPGILLLGGFSAFDRYMPYTGPYASDGAIHLWSDGPAADLPTQRVHGAILGMLAS